MTGSDPTDNRAPEETEDRDAGETDDRAPAVKDDQGSLAETIARAAGQSGLSALATSDTPTGRALFAAMGGVRGLCETILPGLLFLIPYTVLTSVQQPWAQQAAMPVSLGASVAIALVFTLIRVFTKTQATQAVAGLIGVAASAILALLTGNAANNFLLGFVIDAGYGLAVLISMLVGWPLLGLVIGYLMGDGVAWRADQGKRRVMQVLTACWLALFVARLAVQLPLYFAGLTVALGFVKLLMGLPLYATLVLVSWLVTRAVYPPKTSDEASES